MVLLALLNYNLANFEMRNRECASGEIVQLQKSVLDELVTILKNPSMCFLHQLVCFIMIDSFGFLFTNVTPIASAAFVAMYRTAISNKLTGVSEGLCCHMIEQLHLLKAFPYVLAPEDARMLFYPVVQSMMMGKPSTSLNHEFMFCSIRGLVIEVKLICTEYPRELPLMQQQLSDTFGTIMSLLSEMALEFFNKVDIKAKDLNDHPFLRFFGKWPLMLEPFTNLSRIWPLASAYLQHVFRTLVDKLRAWKLSILPTKSATDFHFMVLLFLETFSLYTDFMTSMLDGGAEMKSASKYNWLMNSCRKAMVTPSDFERLQKEFFALARSPVGELDLFMNSLAGEVEAVDCAVLMGFFDKHYKPTAECRTETY
jgi:hypothetical protein